jgi:hypothetical protein
VNHLVLVDLDNVTMCGRLEVFQGMFRNAQGAGGKDLAVVVFAMNTATGVKAAVIPDDSRAQALMGSIAPVGQVQSEIALGLNMPESADRLLLAAARTACSPLGSKVFDKLWLVSSDSGLARDLQSHGFLQQTARYVGSPMNRILVLQYRELNGSWQRRYCPRDPPAECVPGGPAQQPKPTWTVWADHDGVAAWAARQPSQLLVGAPTARDVAAAVEEEVAILSEFGLTWASGRPCGPSACPRGTARLKRLLDAAANGIALGIGRCGRLDGLEYAQRQGGRFAQCVVQGYSSVGYGAVRVKSELDSATLGTRLPIRCVRAAENVCWTWTGSEIDDLSLLRSLAGTTVGSAPVPVDLTRNRDDVRATVRLHGAVDEDVCWWVQAGGRVTQAKGYVIAPVRPEEDCEVSALPVVRVIEGGVVNLDLASVVEQGDFHVVGKVPAGPGIVPASWDAAKGRGTIPARASGAEVGCSVVVSLAKPVTSGTLACKRVQDAEPLEQLRSSWKDLQRIPVLVATLHTERSDTDNCDVFVSGKTSEAS